MTTPRTRSARWSAGALEDRVKQVETSPASKEKRNGTGSPGPWLPGGATNATPRRVSGSQAGSLSSSMTGVQSKTLRSSTSKRRTTAEQQDLGSSGRLQAALNQLQVPRSSPGGLNAEPSASSNDAAEPLPQQQDTSTLSSRAAPATPISEASLLDFWLVLQQTQQNLQDMLVSGVRMSLMFTRYRACFAPLHHVLHIQHCNTSS
jgi:hypothetical protein